MLIRSKLVALEQELRHARTGLLPLEVAERVQHTIVRIEYVLASANVDVAAAETLAQVARTLLDDCQARVKNQPQ